MGEHLPAERSSFIGREKEIARVRDLLGAHRLVSITGMGGVGKTRLALRAVSKESPRFPDGVFFVDLASVTVAELVPRAFAAALGLATGTATKDRPIQDDLAESLGRSSTLLLVDNCEHLLDAAAELVDRLLDACPEVVVCATSRESLGLEGESVFRVPSLSLPKTDTEAAGSEAVRLFVERAGTAASELVAGTLEIAPIANLCRRLDGIPLAIELAAARTSHLSPQEIDARLGDAMHLPAGRRRRPERQQTLEAALDWSHDLLTDGEKIVFRRLGVFPGTLDANAAEEVASDPELSGEAVLELLGSLVEKSLVTTERRRGGIRYRLLETVRAYALRKLNTAGETDALRSGHRDYYLARLEEDPSDRILWTSERVRFCMTEIHNLRAAAAESIAEDRPDLLARLAARVAAGLGDDDSLVEAYGWIHRALEAPDRLTPAERLACYAAAALVSLIVGDGRLVELADEAIELAEHRPSPWLLAALNARAVGRMREARASGDGAAASRAFEDFHRAIRIARSEGIPYWIATGLTFLASEESFDSAEALAHLQEAAEAMRGERGYEGVEAWVLSRLAMALHFHGRGAEACDTAVAALEAQSASGTKQFRNHVVAQTACIVAANGRADDARQHLRSLLAPDSRIGISVHSKMLLGAVGMVAHLAGRSDRAAPLLALARAPAGASDHYEQPPVSGTTVLFADHAALVERAIGRAAWAQAEAEGRAMGVDGGIRCAIEILDLLDDDALDEGAAEVEGGQSRTSGEAARQNALTREGDYWSVTWKGDTFRIRDLRGLHYIRHLLDHPGREFHAADLARLGRGEAPVDRSTGDGTVAPTLGDAGPVLDARARETYRVHLDGLRSELEEARSFHDTGRAEKLESEVEALTEALASAVGLGGRDRKAASSSERARVNVTRTIRDAIKRIDPLAPDLACYLSRTIRTGTFCAWEPGPDPQHDFGRL